MTLDHLQDAAVDFSTLTPHTSADISDPAKIKLYRVFVCSEYKNNILKYFTTHYVCTVCSKCNTEPKKGLSHYDEWRRSVLHSS